MTSQKAEGEKGVDKKQMEAAQGKLDAAAEAITAFNTACGEACNGISMTKEDIQAQLAHGIQHVGDADSATSAGQHNVDLIGKTGKGIKDPSDAVMTAAKVDCWTQTPRTLLVTMELENYVSVNLFGGERIKAIMDDRRKNSIRRQNSV